MKSIPVILLHISLYSLHTGIFAQNHNDTLNYAYIADRIIEQIIELKSEYPKQLSDIDKAEVKKTLTENEFKIYFHYLKGYKWIDNPDYIEGKKYPQKIKKFSKHGIEISIYFYTGDWKGTMVVNPIQTGDMKVVVIVKNEKHEISQSIIEILEEKVKLGLE